MVDNAWNERNFEERNNRDAYKTTLLSFLSSTISDLFIALDIPAFQRYVNDKNSVELYGAQEAYRVLILYSGSYDQIRYIDNQGREEIRVRQQPDYSGSKWIAAS